MAVSTDMFEAALQGTWSTNVLKNGATPKSFTFEETIDVGGGSFCYARAQGCYINQMSLSLAARQSARGTFNMMGQMEALDTAIITGATYTAPNTNNMETAASVANLSVIGLGTPPKIRGLTLNIDNNLRLRPKVGSLYTEEFGVGQCDVTGTMDAYFESNALYAQVLAHGGGALSFTVGAVTNKKYTISMPNVVFLNGARQIGGKNDDVMIQIPFRARLDAGIAASLSITRAVA
jgi:hypothetical protein